MRSEKTAPARAVDGAVQLNGRADEARRFPGNDEHVREPADGRPDAPADDEDGEGKIPARLLPGTRVNRGPS